MNIDIAIVVAFLALTLLVGLGHGREAKTIKDYALGGRDFTLYALVATIVATQASGSGFVSTLTKTYSTGFFFVLASFGMTIKLFFTAFVLTPRMGEFLGKVSVADAMGSIYGDYVRMLTAIAGSVGSMGLVAVQFKVFGGLVEYFAGISSTIAIIISGLIVTVYSALGGIRAVTFTDMLQGVAFGMVIPIVGFVVWSHFYHSGLSVGVALQDPKFNISHILGSVDLDFWNLVLLFMFFSVPTISTPMFQRIAMGSDVDTVKRAFTIAAIIFVIIQIAIAWIPFLIHTVNPGIEEGKLLSHIVDTYSFTGLKGLITVAVVAFAMSTADSYINSSATLLTNDVYNLISLKKNTSDLVVARIVAYFLGIGAIIVSLSEKDILNIIVFTSSFYSPLVAPPLIFTILGFRSSTLSVLIGMISAFIFSAAWKFLPDGIFVVSQNIIGSFFAMLCNIVFLFGSHYLLKQPGGWVGIKDRSYLDQQRIVREERKEKFVKMIKEFDFKKFCQKLSPQSDLTYSTLGLYFIVYTITIMYSTSVELLGDNALLMKLIYPIMLITGTLMLIYPIWPISIPVKLKKRIIQTWYPVSIFYMLIFFGYFFVLVSQFSNITVALFCINTLIMSLLLGWKFLLPTMIIGFYLSINFYQYFFGVNGFAIRFGSPEFILIYMSLLLGSVVIFFFKPRQEYIEETESKVTHLGHEVSNMSNQVDYYRERVSDQEKEIERLGSTAQRILNNVNHELRLPVGNVVNFAEILNQGMDRLSEETLKMVLNGIYEDSTRLSTMILNMLDLAMLSAKEIKLDKKTTNLSEMVETRVKYCRNVYLKDKPIDFKLTIDSEILISVDANYMRQVIDNVIINSINFSESGLIEVSVKGHWNHVKIIVEDEGKGIPTRDLHDVFDPFKMGSNTVSKAKGRGIGLALCKAAIEAHGGSIKAESDGEKGAQFTIVLPR